MCGSQSTGRVGLESRSRAFCALLDDSVERVFRVLTTVLSHLNLSRSKVLKMKSRIEKSASLLRGWEMHRIRGILTNNVELDDSLTTYVREPTTCWLNCVCTVLNDSPTVVDYSWRVKVGCCVDVWVFRGTAIEEIDQNPKGNRRLRFSWTRFIFVEWASRYTQ